MMMMNTHHHRAIYTRTQSNFGQVLRHFTAEKDLLRVIRNILHGLYYANSCTSNYLDPDRARNDIVELADNSQ